MHFLLQPVYMERSILDAVCLSFFLLTTKYLGLCIWWLGFCLGPHSSLEGGGQICKESNTNRSVAVCSARRLLEQYPCLSGEQIYVHTVFIYAHICTDSTPVDIDTTIQPEVENCLDMLQTTKILTEKVLSDSIGVTQGLKQPTFHLQQYPTHLNTLGSTGCFLSTPENAL